MKLKNLMEFQPVFKMYIFRFFRTPIIAFKKDLILPGFVRTITTGKPALCEVSKTKSESESQSEPDPEVVAGAELNKYSPRTVKQHPLEKCIEYMDSKAYNITYGDKPVWTTYVRNFKGLFPPKTRKTCIREGRISTGSPCPICRDEYLVADYRNVKLLKQFISPFGGQILPTKQK